MPTGLTKSDPTHHAGATTAHFPSSAGKPSASGDNNSSKTDSAGGKEKHGFMDKIKGEYTLRVVHKTASITTPHSLLNMIFLPLIPASVSINLFNAQRPAAPMPYGGAAPPIPPWVNANPAAWQAGSWQPNPYYNPQHQAQQQAAASGAYRQWVPGQMWPQNAQGQEQQARDNAWNRYKRPRPIPKEYLKNKLRENPLELYEMIPAAKPPSKEEVQNSPWVWSNTRLPNATAPQPPTNNTGRPRRASDSIPNRHQQGGHDRARADNNDRQQKRTDAESRHRFPPPPAEDINRRPANATDQNDPPPTHRHPKTPHARAPKASNEKPAPAVPPNRPHRPQEYNNGQRTAGGIQRNKDRLHRGERANAPVPPAVAPFAPERPGFTEDTQRKTRQRTTSNPLPSRYHENHGPTNVKQQPGTGDNQRNRARSASRARVPVPPTPIPSETILKAVRGTLKVLTKKEFKCCLIGSAACLFYGLGKRASHGVDIVVLTCTNNKGKLEGILLDSGKDFSLVPSKTGNADDQQLMYTVPEQRAVKQWCPVNIFVPGMLGIPDIPLERVVQKHPDIDIPLMPFSTLLLTKVNGWKAHEGDYRQDEQDKATKDATDISEMLTHLLERYKSDVKAEMKWNLWGFTEKSKVNIGLYIEKYPKTKADWERATGFTF
ncbi:hypothetical protein BDQ17DRAFT_1422414 [Cyathus striatus]|nr:hypothetical protein BDQ17DRAFT_1422414 [Cyathus striatus]